MEEILREYWLSEPWLRMPFYAVLGCMLEVLLTGLMDLIYPRYFCSWNTLSRHPPSAQPPDWIVKGRDLRARSYTFLWMLPVYGMMVLFEPLLTLVAAWPWILRSCLYLALAWTLEFAAGYLLEKTTGRCPWDYRYSRFSFKGYIRWDYVPVWFVFGVIFEFFHPRLVALTPHLKRIFFQGSF